MCSTVCWLEVMFGIGSVCLLVSSYFVILGMVSVLDFFIRDLTESHGFLGRLLAIFLVDLFIFSMWPFVVMCITMGYLFHVWGGVGVGLFFL